MKLCERLKCTGCGACVNRCPKAAISMRPDEEGFSYPVVEETRCVNCGLCTKACPVLTPPRRHPAQATVYAAWAHDEVIRKSSSSGGLFSVFALQVLKQGGLVNGAAFDAGFNLNHWLIDRIEDLPRLRGSKYVQSDTRDVYRKIETALENGKPVLFTGTPCQVAGLRSFLGRDYSKLVTCDFVCHGVPSPAFFRQTVADQYGWSSCMKCDFQFRDLKGWGPSPSLVMEDGNVIRKKPHEDYYFQSFLKGLDCRESCYSCPHASLYRPADLTIGDFWGVPRMFLYKHKETDSGCSLLIVNSENGRRFISKCRPEIFLQSFSVSACRENVQLFHPIRRSALRDVFYSNYQTAERRVFLEDCSQYWKEPVWRRCLHWVKVPVRWCVRSSLRCIVGTSVRNAEHGNRSNVS